MFPDPIRAAAQSFHFLQKALLTNQESRVTTREGLNEARVVRTSDRKRTARRAAETRNQAQRAEKEELNVGHGYGAGAPPTAGGAEITWKRRGSGAGANLRRRGVHLWTQEVGET